ncbi:MAG: hypothetical protein ACREBQ_02680 [Nitrososphaerales archaeon]
MKQLELQVHGFAIDQEIIAQMLSDGKIAFVPINYRERVGKEKAPTWRQGFSAFFTVINLARRFNPIILLSFLASLALIPAAFLFGYGAYLYFLLGEYHAGYFLSGIVLFVLGSQGLVIGSVGSMFRRIERKMNNGFNR